MAGTLKAMIAMLAKIVVHRDMGSLLWLGTVAGYQLSEVRNQNSEIGNW